MKQNLLNKMMNANKINTKLKYKNDYVFSSEQRYRIGYHE